MSFVDIAITKKDRSFFDIDFANGDFVTTDGFDTALLMSILCEARASSSEVAAPERRRGWWGNEANGFDDYNIGSKLWLLFQARSTQQTLNNAKNFVQQALRWMIDDGFLDNVNVTTEFRKISGRNLMEINVDLIRFQNSVLSRGFRIWENTGVIELI